MIPPIPPCLRVVRVVIRPAPGSVSSLVSFISPFIRPDRPRWISDSGGRIGRVMVQPAPALVCTLPAPSPFSLFFLGVRVASKRDRGGGGVGSSFNACMSCSVTSATIRGDYGSLCIWHGRGRIPSPAPLLPPSLREPEAVSFRGREAATVRGGCDGRSESRQAKGLRPASQKHLLPSVFHFGVIIAASKCGICIEQAPREYGIDGTSEEGARTSRRRLADWDKNDICVFCSGTYRPLSPDITVFDARPRDTWCWRERRRDREDGGEIVGFSREHRPAAPFWSTWRPTGPWNEHRPGTRPLDLRTVTDASYHCDVKASSHCAAPPDTSATRGRRATASDVEVTSAARPRR